MTGQKICDRNCVNFCELNRCPIEELTFCAEQIAHKYKDDPKKRKAFILQKIIDFQKKFKG